MNKFYWYSFISSLLLALSFGDNEQDNSNYEYMLDFLSYRWNILLMINFVLCFLTFMGLILMKKLFGELTISEKEVIKTHFFDFFLFRIVFMGSVLNVDIREGMYMYIYNSLISLC